MTLNLSGLTAESMTWQLGWPYLGSCSCLGGAHTCLSSTGWSTGKWLSRITVARRLSLFPVLSHSSAGKLKLIYMTTEKDFKEERGSDSGLDPYTENWHAVTYTTF